METSSGRAGLGRRLAATLFDAVIVGVLFFVIYLFLVPGHEQTFAESLRRKGAGAADAVGLSGDAMRRQKLALYGACLALGYGFLEVLFGGTPGKKFLQLRITDPDTAPASLARRLARYVLKSLPFGLLLAYALTLQPALLWASGGAAAAIVLESFACAGRAERAVHDRIAGTAVALADGVALPSYAADAPLA